MERREDHERLANELDRESDELEQRSAKLGDEISDVHDDWERKRSDEGVPGAPPREDSEDEATDDEATDDD